MGPLQQGPRNSRRKDHEELITNRLFVLTNLQVRLPRAATLGPGLPCPAAGTGTVPARHRGPGVGTAGLLHMMTSSTSGGATRQVPQLSQQAAMPSASQLRTRRRALRTRVTARTWP